MSEAYYDVRKTCTVKFPERAAPTQRTGNANMTERKDLPVEDGGTDWATV